MKRLVRLTFGSLCAGLITDDSSGRELVTWSAPCFKWSISLPISVVLDYYMTRGALQIHRARDPLETTQEENTI